MNDNLGNAAPREYPVELEHVFKSFGFLEETRSELRQLIVPAFRRTLRCVVLSDIERATPDILKKNDNITILSADKRTTPDVMCKTDHNH